MTKLGLSELSMRVRVGRNLTQFNLPGAMDKSERIEFEKAMLKAFDKLKKDPAYGGTVYSLSPDFGDGEKNPNDMARPPEKRRHRAVASIAATESPSDAIGDGEKNPISRRRLRSTSCSRTWPRTRTSRPRASPTTGPTAAAAGSLTTSSASSGLGRRTNVLSPCMNRGDQVKRCVSTAQAHAGMKRVGAESKLNEVFDRLKKMLDTIEVD